MFSLSRHALWARNIARIAYNNKHRWNLNQFKTGVIAAVSVSPPPPPAVFVRYFAGEYRSGRGVRLTVNCTVGVSVRWWVGGGIISCPFNNVMGVD